MRRVMLDQYFSIRRLTDRASGAFDCGKNGVFFVDKSVLVIVSLEVKLSLLK
jgi:hypothetical protein